MVQPPGGGLLEREVLAYEPDVATFAFGVNDIDTDWGVSDETRAAGTPAAWVAAQKALYGSLAFYWAQKELLQARGWLLGKTRIAARRGGPWSPGLARVSQRDYAKNVERFIGTCRAHGIEPVVVGLPVNPYHDWGSLAVEAGAAATEASYEALFARAQRLQEAGLPEAHRRFDEASARTIFAEYERTSAGVAGRESAAFVSLDGAFRAVLPYEGLYLDEVHPNSRGAALIGEFVAETVANLKPWSAEPVLLASHARERPVQN